MKPQLKFFIIFFISAIFIITKNSYTQDKNENGVFDFSEMSINNTLNNNSLNSIVFNQYWESPAGMFSNVNDVAAGYFDGDTLLDVACYTWTTAGTFYIYEQVQTNPDSFAVVYQYSKVESGAFGPINFGDSDGDGQIEIITADFSTLCRLYIFECTGNNTYVSRETQNTLTLSGASEQARFIHITDMNKNGKKEIVIGRSASVTPITCTIKFWEQAGAIGSNTYTNLYTYGGGMYLFGKSGIGDSDNDGWDELFFTYGSTGTLPINVSRLEYDSATSLFAFRTAPLTKTGFPCSYYVADINNDGIKELIMAASSRGAATFILSASSSNSYNIIDSLMEPQDNNSMLCLDVKKLSGDNYPSIVSGSFNGRVYVYTFNGTNFTKQYEKSDLPTGAIRKISWTDIDRKNGFAFHNGNTVRLFKRDTPLGISPVTENPKKYTLEQNYPNPFNPVTRIKFSIKNNSNVTLSVYDISGRKIMTLLNGFKNAGSHSVDFDGTGLSSGIYFYKISTDGFQEARKMILTK